MAALDATMRQLAADLVATYGTTLKLRRAHTLKDRKAGKVTTFPPEEYTLNCAPPRSLTTMRAAFRGAESTPSNFQEGDLSLIVPAMKANGDDIPVTPEIGDIIFFADIELRVIASTPVYSGDLIAYFDMHMRG